MDFLTDSLIRQLSETVVLPIAGLVLTFVAVLLLSNTFNIVMAVFDVSQSVISSAGGVIAGNTTVSPDMLDSLETQLMTMEIGPLLGLWMQSFLIRIVVVVINREIGGMGQNYLKSLCAVGFQGLLILVCVGI